MIWIRWSWKNRGLALVHTEMGAQTSTLLNSSKGSTEGWAGDKLLPDDPPVDSIEDPRPASIQKIASTDEIPPKKAFSGLQKGFLNVSSRKKAPSTTPKSDDDSNDLFEDAVEETDDFFPDKEDSPHLLEWSELWEAYGVPAPSSLNPTLWSVKQLKTFILQNSLHGFCTTFLPPLIPTNHLSLYFLDLKPEGCIEKADLSHFVNANLSHLLKNYSKRGDKVEFVCVWNSFVLNCPISTLSILIYCYYVYDLAEPEPPNTKSTLWPANVSLFWETKQFDFFRKFDIPITLPDGRAPSSAPPGCAACLDQCPPKSLRWFKSDSSWGGLLKLTTSQ